MRIEMRRATRVAVLVMLAGVVGLPGCFSLSRNEPPQRHYVLGAEIAGGAGAEAPGAGSLTIGLRRLRLAPYLDLPFLAVRHGANEVRYSEFHRWGEPLGPGIGRVFTGLLAAGAPVRAVDLAPWPARERHDYLIQLQVDRFEGLVSEDPAVAMGEVLMVASWEIIGPLDGVVLARGRTEHRKQGWMPDDHAGMVRSLDAGLEILAREVAVELAALAARGTGRATR